MAPGGFSNVDFAKRHLNFDDSKSEKYDYVFVSGDIANMPNNTEVADRQETETALTDLENLFKIDIEPFAKQLVYIPGNHDPIELFGRGETKKPVLSTDPNANIHMGLMRLRDDLVVIGLGGSTQNHVQKGLNGVLE